MSEIRGFLYDPLTGEWCGVDPKKPDVVIQQVINPPPNGGWEEVVLSEPRADKHRNVRFNDAKVVLGEDGNGKLVTRPAGTDGAFESYWIIEQPPGWDVTLVFRRHKVGEFGAKRVIQRVLVFVRKA